MLCLLALAAPAAAERQTFRTYDMSNGLNCPSIMALAQDVQGFLWVGTENGLYRYDGSRFIHFGVAEGLPDAFVNNLLAARDGTLVVGTLGGTAWLRDGKVAGADTGAVFRALAPAQGIREGPDGSLYFGTSKGLGMLRPPLKRLDLTYLPQPPGTADAFATGVYVEAAGEVWFGCGKSICRLSGGQVRAFGAAAGVPEERWQAFARDPQGGLWARSRHVLLRMAPGAEAFELLQVEGVGPALRQYPSLANLAGGTMALPSSRGLALLSKDGWRHLTRRHGLPISEVNVVLEDREGSLWLGTPGAGLLRWKGRGSWGYYTEAEGLPGDQVESLVRTPDGNLWAAGVEGLSQGRPSGSGWKWSRQRLPAEEHMLRLASDRNGGLWAASATGNLYYRRPGGGPLTLVASVPGDIGVPGVDRDNRLWLPTNRGVFVSERKDGPLRLRRVEFPPGAPRGSPVCALEDGAGGVWLGTFGGLWHFQRGELRRFGKSDGLASELIAVLAEGPEGAVWVVYRDAKGAALLRRRGDGLEILEHLGKAEGLPTEAIGGVAYDGRGRLWVALESMLAVRQEGQWRYYDQTNGLPGGDLSSGVLRPDSAGGMWAATSRGLAHYTPAADDAVLPGRPPGVVLTGASLGGQALDLALNGWHRSAGPSLRVQLGTLGFSSEQSTRFRYRFLGEDRDAWKEAAQAELIFPALRPGLYQLEVVAVSREGGMSDSPARVDFEILAPWYRRAWFLALALQTAILSVWLAWRWRIRRSRAQQAALAEEVLARTRELRAEKQRVQEQHQEIEQLLAEAIEAGRLRMEFLANTSHEIRTPMHAILCTLALLQDTRLEGEQCEYIDTARTAAKGLLALLDDVLDCTKLEAGRLELAAVEFSPRRVVEETAALLAGRAQEKGLALEVDLPPGSGALVSGDDGRLRQVLLNLLGNAIKFTTEGRVRIELRERAEGERVRLDFAVSDTGIGIAAEKLEVIFDPFRQADGSVTRNFGGTGLGLAISSQLVAAMGGRIEVASVPGKGSRFWFSIALAGAAGRRPAETGPAPGAGLAALDRALDVLVVEDNVVNRRLAERVLDRRGHRVVTAADGQAALELLRCRRVDVVLMDVQMPQMGGLEATRRIRSGEAGPLAGLPIIGFTASATMEDREECFSAGMDDYISKPIEPEALIAAIERYAAPDA